METEICNGMPGYIGEGIKSQRAGSRPSIDLIQLLKKNKEELPTLSELRKTYYSCVEKYETIHGKSSGKGLGPMQKWILSEPINAIKITNIDFIRFFGERRIVTIRKGIGQFEVSDQPYRFTVYSPEIFEKTNFEKSILRYDPIDMSQAYLFDTEDNFLEMIQPSPAANKASLQLTDKERSNLRRHKNLKSNLLGYFSKELKRNKELKAREFDWPQEFLNHKDEKPSVDDANLSAFLNDQKYVDEVREEKRSIP